MVYYMSYSYEENDTDTERTGKIIISGAEVCTITQAAQGMVWITVETVGCGRVDGAGSSHLAYPLGSEVTLTAVADDGYEFLGWNVSFSCSGYGSKQNPITLTAYSCYVTVRFGPLTPEFTKVEPTVVGDAGATVTGDAETGFVIKPSEGKTAVEVTIPQGVDAAKVTVEVSPKVVSVKPNGAKVKVVSGDADITEFLNVPTADGSGVVDLTKATVKEEIVKEAMDVEKGAEIKLNASNPSLTTPNTRKGLFYQFREGETLGGMKNGDSKVGDGQPWSPEIKVKGSNSAFYSIGVGKGE